MTADAADSVEIVVAALVETAAVEAFVETVVVVAFEETVAADSVGIAAVVEAASEVIEEDFEVIVAAAAVEAEVGMEVLLRKFKSSRTYHSLSRIITPSSLTYPQEPSRAERKSGQARSYPASCDQKGS